MMKKLLVAWIILIAGFSTATAQNSRRIEYWRQDYLKEIYASYGIEPMQVAFEAHVSSYGNASADPSTAIRIQRSTLAGPIIVGYNHHISEQWTVGIQGSIASFDTEYRYMASRTTNKAQMRYFTLMPRTDYRWVAGRTVQIYSTAAIGASLGNARFEDGTTENKILFAFQVNPIGIRIGRGFGVFAEAGVGYNGLFTFGISQKL